MRNRLGSLYTQLSSWFTTVDKRQIAVLDTATNIYKIAVICLFVTKAILKQMYIEFYRQGNENRINIKYHRGASFFFDIKQFIISILN